MDSVSPALLLFVEECECQQELGGFWLQMGCVEQRLLGFFLASEQVLH